MRKSFGDPICGGLLVDASAVGPVKEIDASFFPRRTACGCGNCSGSRQQKPAKSLSPRGPAERKIETFSARGPSGEVGHPPHRLRGTIGHSVATELQVTPRPIRQKRGSGVSPAVFPPTFGRTARRPLSSPPPAGHSNERKWARRRQPPPGRGTPQKKIETSLSPRGDSRSPADRPAGYEAASGLKDIQRQPGRKLPPDQLDKKGVRGLPGGVLVTLPPRAK